MTHSHSEVQSSACDRCGEHIKADCWLIVDIVERPDLMAQICSGTIHDAVCPHCGATVRCDAPLLVFRPERTNPKPANAVPGGTGQGANVALSAQAEQPAGSDSPILFSPAENTTSEQDWQHARHLLSILRQALGEEWLPQGIPMVPRGTLCEALGAPSCS